MWSPIKTLLKLTQPTLACLSQTAQLYQQTSPLLWTSPGSCTTRVGSARCDFLLSGQNIFCGCAPASPGNLVSPRRSAARRRSRGRRPEGPEGWRPGWYKRVPHRNETEDSTASKHDAPADDHSSREAAEVTQAEISPGRHTCCALLQCHPFQAENLPRAHRGRWMRSWIFLHCFNSAVYKWKEQQTKITSAKYVCWKENKGMV